MFHSAFLCIAAFINVSAYQFSYVENYDNFRNVDTHLRKLWYGWATYMYQFLHLQLRPNFVHTLYGHPHTSC